MRVDCGYKPAWSEYCGTHVTLILDLTYILEVAAFEMYYGVHDLNKWRYHPNKYYSLRRYNTIEYMFQYASNTVIMSNLFPNCKRRTCLLRLTIACAGASGGNIYVYDGHSELSPLIFQHTFGGTCNQTLLHGKLLERFGKIIMVSHNSLEKPYKFNIKVIYKTDIHMISMHEGHNYNY